MPTSRLIRVAAAAALLVSATESAPLAQMDTSLFAGLRWRSIGPNRGGRSQTAEGSASRPLEYYFGATGGGLWKTIDGGTTWKPVTDPLTPGTSGKPHIPRPRFAYFDHDPSNGLPTGQRRVDVYIGSQGRGAWRIRLDIP